MVVFFKHLAGGLAFAVLQSDWGDFFRQTAGLLRCASLLLRLQREFIHFFPIDSLLLGVKLGGVGHVKAAIGIQQGHHERVFHFAFAQAESPTRSANYVRRLRHGFHTTGQHRIRLTQLDHLGSIDQRLHA